MWPAAKLMILLPVSPEEQHRSDLRASRSHHISIIRVSNVNGLCRCTAAEPQGFLKNFPVGLVGPDGVPADHTRCLQPIEVQGLFHVGEAVVGDDVDGDRAPNEKVGNIREHRGIDPVATQQPPRT